MATDAGTRSLEGSAIFANASRLPARTRRITALAPLGQKTDVIKLRRVKSCRLAERTRKFIPVAEECGLIIPIGEWSLKEAFRQMKDWEAVGFPPVTVAVNVSARQFHNDGLCRVVSDLLDESGLSPQLLELEVTESAIISDLERAKVTLQKLRELGVRVALDDLGPGTPR